MNKQLKGEIVKKYGSQFAFAHAIGWHEAVVSRVVRGHHKLDHNTKKKWAEALGADADTLFNGGSDDDR